MQSASNGHLNGHGVYGHAHNTEKEPLRQGELSTAEHQNGGGFNVLEVQMPPEGQQERAEFRWGHPCCVMDQRLLLQPALPCPGSLEEPLPCCPPGTLSILEHCFQRRCMVAQLSWRSHTTSGGRAVFLLPAAR